MAVTYKFPLVGLRILITGGCGFIGSHLVESLYEKNDVYVLDNNHSSNDLRFDGVKYVFGNTSSIGSLFEGQKFDIIYHFGEYSRVEQSLDEFQKVVELNLSPLPRVLEFVKLSGAKLIYSGSSTRFYDNAAGEDLSPYTFSKATNAKFVKNFANWYNIDYAICYFYNVFGGREISKGKYSTVVGRFLESYRNKEAVYVTAPGSQERNFTHINDTVAALNLIGAQGIGDDYCIANEKSVSILELVEFLGLEYSFAPSHPSNRLSGPIPSSKLQDLGWVAHVDIFDYLRKCMDDCNTR